MKRILLLAILILCGASLAMAAPFKIALSNSFMGNDWRQEMEKVAQAVAGKEPLKSQATLTIINCDNTPEAQSDSIDSLVKQGYQAILVDAASPSALNPAIDRAIKAGVVIISFDQVVDHAQAWKIETDFNKVPKVQATYIAKAIGGKGDIVIDRGLPGAPISKQLEDGARAVFAQYPGIKIVAGFDGQYAQGPTLQGMNSIMASRPKIAAVFTQGYTGPVIKALTDAGHPMVPMSGFDYNGDILAAIDAKANVIIANNIPGLGALAYKTAIDILKGANPPKHMLIDPLFLATDSSINAGAPLEKIALGVNAWREMPYGFDWPVLPKDFPVQLTAQEAVVTQ